MTKVVIACAGAVLLAAFGAVFAWDRKQSNRLSEMDKAVAECEDIKRRLDAGEEGVTDADFTAAAKRVLDVAMEGA